MTTGAEEADWILHVDLDQFLAAVEILRRPELAGRPVVVGGDGDPRRPRQVVATASYEARAYGVRSGMSLGLALRKCPEAVFLASDRPAYDAASAQVMATLRTFPVVVEVWGWDEAFVGARTADPEGLAHALKARVFDETGLTDAVGIGETRLQAKTATGFAKPGGVARLTWRTWIETMGDRPVTALWGIGDRTAARLADQGIRSVVDLARADHHELAHQFGPTIGPHLRLLGLGGHDGPLVDEPHVPRSRSREVTFEHDLVDRAEIDGHVARLAAEVTESVVAEGRRITHAAVKVRTATFFTRTKISKLAAPTTDPTAVAAMALAVLDRFELDRPVRLLGVRVVLELPALIPVDPVPRGRRVQTAVMATHYRAPGWFTRNVFNRAIAFLTRHGVSVLGSRVLAVRGRTSGEWRTTPVNLLEVDGRRYLVAPRGETQWVLNLRARGGGELRVGSKVEPFLGRELGDDEDKVAVLRAYLKRWKVEVGVFFDGVGPDSTDQQLLDIAPRHPAFEVLPTA